MPRLRSSALLSLSLVIAACSSTPATTRPLGGSASASASSAVPPGSASAGSGETAPDAEPIANVGPMSVVMTTDMEIMLFTVKDAAFAVLGNNFYRPIVYRVDDAAVTEEASFDKGLKVNQSDATDPSTRYFRIEGMSGLAAGDLDIVFNEPGERGGTTYDAHRRAGVWKRDTEQPYYGMFFGPNWVPMQDGSILITNEESGAPTALKKVPNGLFLPDPGGWTPKATKVGAKEGCATAMARYTRLLAFGGATYGIGVACAGKGAEGGAAIESWKWGAGGVFAELPGYPFDPNSAELRVGPDERTYLFANGMEPGAAPYVARFDGNAWTDLSPTMGYGAPRFEIFASKIHLFTDNLLLRRDGETWTPVPLPKLTTEDTWSRYVEAPDGAVWATRDAHLYRLAPGGTRFERVALPKVGEADVAVDAIAFTPNGDALVSGKAGDKGVLLLPTTRAKPVAAPARPKNKVAFGDVKPATAGCAKPFVVLYGMMKTTPDDYDFPLTRKAIKGKTKYKDVRFFVTRDAGQRFLVARVPDVQTGKDLVSDISSSLKDSKPQLLCGDPAETIRELKIDVATGDVVK